MRSKLPPPQLQSVGLLSPVQRSKSVFAALGASVRTWSAWRCWGTGRGGDAAQCVALLSAASSRRIHAAVELHAYIRTVDYLPAVGGSCCFCSQQPAAAPECASARLAALLSDPDHAQVPSQPLAPKAQWLIFAGQANVAPYTHST